MIDFKPTNDGLYPGNSQNGNGFIGVTVVVVSRLNLPPITYQAALQHKKGPGLRLMVCLHLCLIGDM